MVGLDNVKAKINRFYPKKIVLDTIRRDVFLYIYIYIYRSVSLSRSLSLSLSLLNLITSLVPVVTVFFL